MRRPDPADEGASLIELLVVVVLVGVLGLLVTSTSIRGLDTVRGTEQRAEDTQAARVALASMTQRLRTAVDPDTSTKPLTMFVAGSGAADVTFYANTYRRGTRTATSAPDRVRFVVESGALVEYVTAGVRDATTGDPSWPGTARRRVLASGAVPNGSGAFLFTYVKRQQTPALPEITDSSGTLTTQGLSGVGSVEITLSVQRTSARRAVTVLSRVALVNSRKAEV